MHDYLDQANTLASVAADGTVYRYTPTGWVPAALAVPGPGWWAISASEAVTRQRAITFGRMK